MGSTVAVLIEQKAQDVSDSETVVKLPSDTTVNRNLPRRSSAPDYIEVPHEGSNKEG